eukprot:CAMPEP_0114281106 /NCGR_PEP_ID=MMETSP0059-20121206/2801_1 /TAXON_ID=36894 /ORGANISM="Pyramimonas parkeae, Strain CCMP726" /LENGTH=46 /DNA_ID= /DNA_START= /DNA_END= /DNA_ORIENTATION=
MRAITGGLVKAAFSVNTLDGVSPPVPGTSPSASFTAPVGLCDGGLA